MNCREKREDLRDLIDFYSSVEDYLKENHSGEIAVVSMADRSGIDLRLFGIEEAKQLQDYVNSHFCLIRGIPFREEDYSEEEKTRPEKQFPQQVNLSKQEFDLIRLEYTVARAKSGKSMHDIRERIEMHYKS